MRPRALALVILALLVAGGCSPYRLNREEMLPLSLEGKIEIYAANLKAGKIPPQRTDLLGTIADHGLEAALAMAPFLARERRDLPLEDALAIVMFVQADGVPIQGTSIEPLVRALTESREPQVRRRAQVITAIMEGRDPRQHLRDDDRTESQSSSG